LALKNRDPFAFDGMTPRSHRRSLIWIKLAMHFLRVLEVTELSSFFLGQRTFACAHWSWEVRRSYKSLTELAQIYNPRIRGWISYYVTFKRSNCG
jgi:hypothetical protein